MLSEKQMQEQELEYQRAQEILNRLNAEYRAWTTQDQSHRFHTELLWAQRMIIADKLARGFYTADTAMETMALQQHALGQIAALDEILSFDAAKILSIEQEIADAKHFRSPPSRVFGIGQDGPRRDDDGVN